MSQPHTIKARQWVYAACAHGRSGSPGFQTWSASDGVSDDDCAELSELSHIGAGLVSTPASKADRCVGLVPLRSGKFAFFVVRRDGRDDLGRAGPFISALLFDKLADVPPHPLTLWSSPALHPPLTEAQVRSPAPEHLPPVDVEHASRQTDERVAAIGHAVATADRRELAGLLLRGLGGGADHAMLVTGSEPEILAAMSMVWAFASARERRRLGLITYLPEPIGVRFQLSGWPYDLGRPAEKMLRQHHSIFRWGQGLPDTSVPRDLADRLRQLLAPAVSLSLLGRAREELGAATLGAMTVFPRLTDPSTPAQLADGALPFLPHEVVAELKKLAESRDRMFLEDCAEVIKKLCGPEIDLMRTADERFMLEQFLPMLQEVEKDSEPVRTTWVVSQRIRQLGKLFLEDRGGATIEGWWGHVLPYLGFCEGRFDLLQKLLGGQEPPAAANQQLPFLLDCVTLLHTLSGAPRVPAEHLKMLNGGLHFLQYPRLPGVPSHIYGLAPLTPRAFLLWASVFDGAADRSSRHAEDFPQFCRNFLYHWAHHCRVAGTPLDAVADLEGRLLDVEVTANFLYHWFSIAPRSQSGAMPRKPPARQAALAEEWAAFATRMRWHAQGPRFAEAAFRGLLFSEGRQLTMTAAAASAIPGLGRWKDMLFSAWAAFVAKIRGRPQDDHHTEAAYRSLLSRPEVIAAAIPYLGQWGGGLRHECLKALDDFARHFNSIEITRQFTASPWPEDGQIMDLINQQHRLLRPWFALSHVRAAAPHVLQAAANHAAWFAEAGEDDPVRLELRNLLEDTPGSADTGRSVSATMLALPQRVMRTLAEPLRATQATPDASAAAPASPGRKRGCFRMRHALFLVLLVLILARGANAFRPQLVTGFKHRLAAALRFWQQPGPGSSAQAVPSPDPPQQTAPPGPPKPPMQPLVPPPASPLATVAVAPPPAPAPAPAPPTKLDHAQLEKDLGELSKHPELHRQAAPLELLGKARLLNDQLKGDPSPEGRRLLKALQDLIQRWNGPFQAHVEVMQLRPESGLEALDLIEAFAALVPGDSVWKRKADQARLQRPAAAASAQRARADLLVGHVAQKQMSAAEALLKANPALEQDPLLAPHLARLREALRVAGEHVAAAKAAAAARKADDWRRAIARALEQDRTNEAALSLRIKLDFWTHDWDEAARHVKALPEGSGKTAWVSVADSFRTALETSKAADYPTLADAAALKAAQTTLAKAGWYPGTPDGRTGSGTIKAILLFQKQNKLPLSGLLDPATLEALAKVR